MFKKLKLAILILDKNSLSYYDEFNSLNFELPKNIVQDLEVIDKGKLIETIDLFIKNNKLIPKNILMVLNAPLFFEKTFKDQVDIETQIKKFLENVPFENISSRLMVDEKESKLMVTNRNFFMPIKNAFESEGFTVNLVLPYLALEKLKLDIKKKIDNKTAKEFNQKLKLLEENNLLIDATELKAKRRGRLSFIKILKIKKNRLSTLLSVFLILILILMALLILKKPLSNSPPEEAQVKDVTLISPTPSENNITASEKTLENTTIKITYSGQKLKIANIFKDQLVQQGFKNITVENENSQSNTPKTFVIFSLNFPEILKEKIMARVNKTFIDVAVQESNEIESDVLITVGQAY